MKPRNPLWQPIALDRLLILLPSCTPLNHLPSPLPAGFYNFILHPSILTVAIGFVLGGAFKDLVSAFVAAFVTPLIGMIAGEDFSSMKFTVLGSSFYYGNFINALITFIFIALAIYVCLVYPLVTFTQRFKVRACPECCSDDLQYSATRCKHCTAPLPPMPKKHADDEEVAAATA